MVNNQLWTSKYYLAADEQMQLDITSTNLPSGKEAYSFLIRTTCIEVLDKIYGTAMPFQMVYAIHPKNQSISIQLDLVDWATVNPANIKTVVEKIQSSPQLATLIFNCIELLKNDANYDELLELEALEQFYLTTLPNGITSFSASKQAQDLVYLFDIKAILPSTKFKMSAQGGKLKFTFSVGFTQDTFIQMYDVSCIMYLFINEEQKLGYYFEFFLDEGNFHHQEIYRALPDQLMKNTSFLNMVADIMEQHKQEDQQEHLKQLVSLFKASM